MGLSKWQRGFWKPRTKSQVGHLTIARKDLARPPRSQGVMSFRLHPHLSGLAAALLLAFLPTAGATDPAKKADPAPFITALEAIFPSWDLDKNGALSMAELDERLADPEVKGEEAAVLAAVKRLARGKTTGAVPRTLDCLREIAATPAAARSYASQATPAPDLPAMFKDSLRRIQQAKRELFVGSGPALEKLRQGKMGNCFSLAPLGCLLHRNPNDVRSMLRAHEDGTYTVKLGAREVRVPAPTEAEIALSSSSESTGLWSNVYEKAAGVARNELRDAKDRVGTPLDAIARGGSAGTMLAFITGHEMVRFTLSWAKNSKTTPEDRAAKLTELRSRLTQAFSSGACVTTGTTSPKMPGILGGHAYGVLGYDAATDGITVWDPHGDDFTPKGEAGPKSGYPRKDGVCTMPLEVFASQFAGLAFEILPGKETPKL